MNEVLHANIFFLIMGIAVIIFSTLLCVAIFHGIKALQSLRRTLDRIEEGTEVIVEDLGQLRAYFSEDGLVKRLINTVMGRSSRPASREGRAHAKKARTKEE